ncbi:MAG TPA: hypothetical protein VLZ05_16175 [Mycobacterium sp.]|nr:hypothetical protein [Mycobacterium sp.]HUH70252.1 hypothetical protein [Mycobacterium sp.]
MIGASLPAYREYVCDADTVDGLQVPVTLSGPDNGRMVIMLDETPRRLDVYDCL